MINYHTSTYLYWLINFRKKFVYSSCTGFDAVMQYIYSGDETVVISLGDLDLLFEVFRLADKVTIKCARSSS
jgi:hypothetical protein